MKTTIFITLLPLLALASNNANANCGLGVEGHVKCTCATSHGEKDHDVNLKKVPEPDFQALAPPHGVGPAVWDGISGKKGGKGAGKAFKGVKAMGMVVLRRQESTLVTSVTRGAGSSSLVSSSSSFPSSSPSSSSSSSGSPSGSPSSGSSTATTKTTTTTSFVPSVVPEFSWPPPQTTRIIVGFKLDD